MKPVIRKLATLIGSAFVAAIPAHAQTASPINRPSLKVDVIATYDGMRLQTEGGGSFQTQGAGVEVHKKIASGIGVVADATETRAPATAALSGLDLLTLSIGPRFTESRREGQFDFFAQGMAGKAVGTHSSFPCSAGTCTHASGLEFQLGYGADFRVRDGLLIRLIQVDWVHTQLPNGGTNSEHNFRYSTGIVLQFH